MHRIEWLEVTFSLCPRCTTRDYLESARPFGARTERTTGEVTRLCDAGVYFLPFSIVVSCSSLCFPLRPWCLLSLSPLSARGSRLKRKFRRWAHCGTDADERRHSPEKDRQRRTQSQRRERERSRPGRGPGERGPPAHHKTPSQPHPPDTPAADAVPDPTPGPVALSVATASRASASASIALCRLLVLLRADFASASGRARDTRVPAPEPTTQPVDHRPTTRALAQTGHGRLAGASASRRLIPPPVR